MLAGCTPWPDELAGRYRRAGYWRGEVLGDLLRAPARLTPDRTALVTGSDRLSYAALDARCDRLAAGLADLGLRAGDRVVVQLPNGADLVLVLVALFRLGVVPVLALPQHREREIGHLVTVSAATALITCGPHRGYDHRELARAVRVGRPFLRTVLISGDPGDLAGALPLSSVDGQPRWLPRPPSDEVAFFLLSGGTTGTPKLIPRTHDDYAYQLRASAASIGLPEYADAADPAVAPPVYLAALPAAHNAALGCPGVLGTLRMGGTVVLAASPAPDDVLPLAEREGATLTTAMPPVLAVWAECAPLLGVDVTALTIEVGGARLDPAVVDAVRSGMGSTVLHFFGMAEGLLCHTARDDPDPVVSATQGHPICPADELRVVDEREQDVRPGEVGQLLVRGPTTLRGYYRGAADTGPAEDPAFTPDGFLRTGDLVRTDAAGRLVVTGRIKDVINRGGEKVQADEVEAELAGHSGVRAVAVTALPDPVLGERVGAFVVPVDPLAPPSPADLIGFLRDRGLAVFKLPDRVTVVAELPRTAAGKIDKRALAATAGAPGIAPVVPGMAATETAGREAG
jgi:2,3-dihydroxybenzoate-AMP ligase